MNDEPGNDATESDLSGADLSGATLADVLGERPLRSYPALLSTEATAMAWARQGAPSGAVVVANYQASPRGRGGLPWTVRPGTGIGFTLISRPELPPAREGWPYVPALLALHDVAAPTDSAGLAWPDALVAADGRTLARLGVYVELGPGTTRWVSVTVLIEQAAQPRGQALARALRAVEARLAQPPPAVLECYRRRCVTLGQQVRARLIPMGPGGPEVSGQAVDVLEDGALVVLTPRGSRVAVPPQNLGLLEPPAEPAHMPAALMHRPLS